MSRMTVTLDPDLVREAQEALGTRSKADTLRRALQEVIRQDRLTRAVGHRGSIELEVDRERLAELRSEG